MRWIFRKTKLNLKLKRITYSSLLSGDVTFISNTSHSTVFAWIVSILEHSFAILWCTPAQGLIKNRHFCKIYIESLFFIFFFYFLFGFATQMSAFIDEHAAVSVCVCVRQRKSEMELHRNSTQSDMADGRQYLNLIRLSGQFCMIALATVSERKKTWPSAMGEHLLQIDLLYTYSPRRFRVIVCPHVQKRQQDGRRWREASETVKTTGKIETFRLAWKMSMRYVFFSLVANCKCIKFCQTMDRGYDKQFPYSNDSSRFTISASQIKQAVTSNFAVGQSILKEFRYEKFPKWFSAGIQLSFRKIKVKFNCFVCTMFVSVVLGVE